MREEQRLIHLTVICRHEKSPMPSEGAVKRLLITEQRTVVFVYIWVYLFPSQQYVLRASQNRWVDFSVEYAFIIL